MFGILLVLGGVFAGEIALDIGKREYDSRKETLIVYGFLSILAATVAYAISGFVTQSGFAWDPASLPTLLLRGILEILQIEFSLHAVFDSSRSTYAFIKAGTIPLVVIADLLVGTQASMLQYLGIGLILATLLALAINHEYSTKALGWLLASTVNAAILITVFKYNITHYNSIATEQLIVCIFLLVYLSIRVLVARENPFKFLRQIPIAIQTGLEGLAYALSGFAYLFAPAAVITTASRASGILVAIVAGQWYFKERHPLVKGAAVAIIAFALYLLTQ